MAIEWTLLMLAQEFSKRTGIAPPAQVVGSFDDQTLQIWGLLNEEVTELAARGDWPEFHYTFTFTHSNGPDYLAYNYATVQPDPMTAGMRAKYIVKDTLWDATTKTPVNGPVSDSEWREMVMRQAGPFKHTFKRSTKGIHIYPVPSPLNSVSFSADIFHGQPVTNTGGGVFQDMFEADTDKCVLPGAIVLAGLRWRWKKEKGLAYAEDKETYELQIGDRLGRGMGARDLHLDSREGDFPPYAKPGVMIPAGNWDL